MCGCGGSSKPIQSIIVKKQTATKQVVISSVKRDTPAKLQVIRKSSVQKCPQCHYPMAEVNTSRARMICTNCRYTQND